MMNIIDGDATKPKDWVRSTGTNHKYIIHVCNDEGKWGAGFVLALTKKWPWVENSYRKWSKGAEFKDNDAIKVISDDNSMTGFHLGAIQIVDVTSDISVINMIGQRSCGPDEYGHPPIRYYAIDECMKKVSKEVNRNLGTVHLPYLMGCALAGGSWPIIDGIISMRLSGIPTTAYQFKG
jgi:hypothetical protein